MCKLYRLFATITKSSEVLPLPASISSNSNCAAYLAADQNFYKRETNIGYLLNFPYMKYRSARLNLSHYRIKRNIMSKILLFILSTGFSVSAFANCFLFVNGQGPSTIGNVLLNADQHPHGQSYKAKEICVKKVNQFGGGSHTSVTLSDDEGELASFAASVFSGRCGPNYCKRFKALSGSAMGKNLTAEQMASIELAINVQEQRLGFSGTLTDVLAEKSYRLFRNK